MVALTSSLDFVLCPLSGIAREIMGEREEEGR
jgi:hypothetical protein